ncbi:glycosyltransferase family 4 protein [Lactococcus lactis]|uniref:glycosyltransferase family 4 protein n=1 Tax=Lactococcus lactis TaxID=1358 RepID=UPI00117AF126|nr:glycosyltransferase family 4 protein [Lactococcus lactis]TRW74001.1 glycosyltransferase family 4 protein [Lactococcus lactis]
MDKNKIIIFQMKGPTSQGITGGAENYSEELANILEKMGYTVEIYCSRDKGEQNLPNYEQRTEKISVRRFNSPLNFLPLSIFPMHWYYLTKGRRNSNYVIENQSVMPMFTTIYKESILTVIHHLTGKDYIRKQGKIKGSIGIILENILMPLIYRRQNILTVSQHSKESIVAVGFNKNKIKVIPPIVQKSPTNVLYSSKRKNIISYIGRYTGRTGNKRIDDVVEIMPMILKKIPDAKLIIGGSIKRKEELTEIINKNNLQSSVEFKGFLKDDEKSDILSKSKVFASPSYQEGFGITYVEAQSYGTPVVGYEIPGLDTVPPEAGFMVEKGNKYKLASSIIELLDNNEVWESKSKGALDNASLYRSDRIKSEYQKYLEQIINSMK